MKIIKDFLVGSEDDLLRWVIKKSNRLIWFGFILGFIISSLLMLLINLILNSKP